MEGGGGAARRLAGQTLRSLADLALPVRCGGCGSAGSGWCATCRSAVAAAEGFAWSPTPAPPGMPRVWAAVPYDVPVRPALVAWKDEGRRDLTPVLASLLAVALAAAVADPGSPVGAELAASQRLPVVPVPSSRAAVRRRGDRPVPSLVDRVLTEPVRAAGLHRVDALRLVRSVHDQAGLDAQGRAANLGGAMALAVRHTEAVQGRCAVVVDDVVTSGATLAEAARVLRAAGAREVVGVVVAATRRTFPPRRAGQVSPVGQPD